MGAAKRKQLAQERVRQQLSRIDLHQLLTTVQGVMAGCSEHLGADCLLHAKAVACLLNEEGIDNTVQIGWAAWRVDGDQPHAVIGHSPEGQAETNVDGKAMYHAWVEVAGLIIDATTYQLSQKAAAMDACDGQTTRVTWAPPYLITELSRVDTWATVRDSFQHGVFFYKPTPRIRSQLIGEALDPDDVAMLVTVYRARNALPSLKVAGPFSNRSQPDASIIASAGPARG